MSVLDGDGLQTPAIRLSLKGVGGVPLVARINGAEDDAESHGEFQEVVVPAAGDVTVPVVSGAYDVTLFLPTGRIIRERCIVSGGSEPVVFDAEGALSRNISAGDRFSLQGAFAETAPDQLVDAIRDRLQGDANAELRVVPPADTPSRSRELRGSFGSPGVLRSGVRAAPPQRADSATLSLAYGSDFLGEAAWRTLATSSPGLASAYPTVVPTSQNAMSLWELETLPEGAGRAWARVMADRGSELAAVPLPWRQDRRAAVAVMVDPAAAGRAMTDVAVQDEEMAGLLTYLEQGRLSLIAPLLRKLEEDGVIDRVAGSAESAPLVACAAAYAFLATFEPERAERWTVWLETLFDRHSDVPDCGVVLARLKLLTPGVEATRAAAEPLAAAFRAGVPYFSTGLLTLRDMLLAGAARNPSQAGMLSSVEAVAARCDPSRLFTVLRYPRL